MTSINLHVRLLILVSPPGTLMLNYGWNVAIMMCSAFWPRKCRVLIHPHMLQMMLGMTLEWSIWTGHCMDDYEANTLFNGCMPLKCMMHLICLLPVFLRYLSSYRHIYCSPFVEAQGRVCLQKLQQTTKGSNLKHAPSRKL